MLSVNESSVSCRDATCRVSTEAEILRCAQDDIVRQRKATMLLDLLEKNRAALRKRWFDLIVESYAPDVAGFLRREQDPFRNPVGQTLWQETEAVLQELLGGMDGARLSEALDNIVKIRAVQDLSASQAVGFVFLLKKAVRDMLKGNDAGLQPYEGLLEFESRIDRVALLAFDLYMQRRNKIHEIRTRELRDRSGRILERINRIYGTLDRDVEGPDLDGSEVMRGSAR